MSREQVRAARAGEVDVSRYVRGRPSFRSSAVGSAVWLVVQGDKTWIYRSQGDTAVRTIQCALGVRPDGWWGPRTMAALRRELDLRGITTSDVGSDGVINKKTLELALAIAFRTPIPGASDTEDTVVIDGSSLPAWMAPSPSDGQSNGVTWRGELPMTPTLPSARTHPSYGSGPFCQRVARSVYLAHAQSVAVQRPAAGFGNSWEPVGAETGDGQASDGDAPSLPAYMIFAAAAVVVGIAVAVATTD